MATPKFSIITPVKNRVTFIKDCVESVARQDYAKIEHLIVDGGSTDGTLDILGDLAEKYPSRVRVISEPDDHVVDAINKGWRLASGEILGWLGSDDMLYGKEAISLVADYFRHHLNIKFVYGSCQHVDIDGNLLYVRHARPVDLVYLINNQDFIPFTSAFYRREVVETLGGFVKDGRDYDFKIRAAKIYEIGYMEQVLSVFKHHEDTTTGNFAAMIEIMREDYRAVRKHGAKIFSRNARRYFLFETINALHLAPLLPILIKIKKSLSKSEPNRIR